MAYDDKLANRVREALIDIPGVEERILFQGLAFMIEEKLCICVRDQTLLCRVGPEEFEFAAEQNGVEPMIHNKRVMTGYVYVNPQAYESHQAFTQWIDKCLAFNKFAKSSKKKK